MILRMPRKTRPCVFDSSTLILYLNDALSNASTEKFLKGVEDGAILISAVTRAEVLAWPEHNPQSLETATKLLDVLHFCDVDQRVADEAACIRRDHGLKLPDALIAATAKVHQTPIATANGRDFSRVADLLVISVV